MLAERLPLHAYDFNPRQADLVMSYQVVEKRD